MPRPTPATTLDPRSTDRRWRTAVAFCLSLALGSAGTTAASAATDPPAPDEPPAISAPPIARVVEFPMSLGWTDRYWSYGTSPSEGEPITLVRGPDTRTLVLDANIEPIGSVVCEFGDPDEESGDPIATAQWTAEQWSSAAPKTLAIPEDPASEHYVRCDSGAADQPNWTIEWWLYNQGADAGAVVVLPTDKYLSASSDTYQYTSPGPPKPVRPGDTVRISGPPGTWPQNENMLVWLRREAAPIRFGASVDIDGAVVSADGSTVQFQMAAEPRPGTFGPDAIIQVVTRSSVVIGPPRVAELISFRAPLVYAAEPTPNPNPPASTVALTLSGRYALSFQQRTATAVVKTTGSPTPAGTVSFAVNGKPVGTTPLGANGKAAFRLPALDRGRYSITTTFTPANGTPGAVSPGVWLRVLR